MSDNRAFFGVIAMGAGQATKYLLQFAVLPLLARKLGPAAYGVVALAMPFILFANLISDMGLGNALVRVQAPSRVLESTVFWMSELICTALALLICLLAWPASLVFSAPELTWVLVALSPILLLGGSLSVANARITRERRFAVFAAGDTFASVLSAGVAIAAAYAGAGAWSLVIQQLILWTVKAVWVHSAVRFRPAFAFDFSTARPFMAFGFHAAASNVADLISKSLPALIIGALMTVRDVGHYSMASQIIRIPDAIISGPIYMAVFSAVAKQHHDQTAVSTLTVRALRAIAAGTAPMFLGLAGVADLAVHLFLGAKWTDTTGVLIWLTPAGYLFCLYSVVQAALMGLGRSDMALRLVVLGGLLMNLGVAIGSQFGVSAVAAGISIGTALAGPAVFMALARALGVSAWGLMLDTAPPLLGSGGMLLALLWLRPHLTNLAEPVQLAACIALGAVVYCVILGALSGRQILADLRHVLPGRRIWASTT
jgi:PST family polysaccharide transporter